MKYTVIVAEDEALLLNNLIAKIQASDSDFEVIGSAQTGVQAYSLIESLSPDLLITDIRMPAMDGITLIKKVHENYPYIDFIITSGFSDFEYAKAAIQYKVSDYLLKPIDAAELHDALIKLQNQYLTEHDSIQNIFTNKVSSSSPAEIAGILKEYLIHHFNEDINLNLIAHNMNYSSSYLTKIFVQHYQCSPTKFLISLRMQKAQQLLSHNSDLLIHQVGEAVGYPDQGYFSRIFKKQTGLSPLEYREKDSSL